MRADLWSNSLLKHILTKRSPHSFFLQEFEQNVKNNACRYILNIQQGDKTKGDSSLY
jgi:hypothetical protein